MNSNQAPLTIILSPHFDDAIFSLGGLIAKRQHQLLVATFFTKKPTEVMYTEWDNISGFSDSDEAIFTRTKENKNALMPFNSIIKNYNYLDSQYEKENRDQKIKNKIIEDIQSIFTTYKDRELFIYGPANFGSEITHPDHQIVYNAFMDVLKISKKLNINFFIYEDFPYIHEFTMLDLGNLKTKLEKKEKIKFQEIPIELNEVELLEKISSIYTYKSQVKAFFSLDDNIGIMVDQFNKSRCKTILPLSYACEVVYSPLN